MSQTGNDLTKYILGVDIGGSHVASALVETKAYLIVEGSLHKRGVNANGTEAEILTAWREGMLASCRAVSPKDIRAIGIAIPGPFDYENGISLIQGVNKYEALYGKNLREIIAQQLHNTAPIYFENDAGCFGLGQTQSAGLTKLLAITLGTGIGSAFVHDGELITERDDVPADGYLYNYPFRDGIAEDYLSGRFLLKSYQKLSGEEIASVKALAEKASADDEIAKNIFIQFGNDLGNLLQSVLHKFSAQQLVIGGGIVHAADLFLPAMQSVLTLNRISLRVSTITSTEEAAIIGAARMAGAKIS